MPSFTDLVTAEMEKTASEKESKKDMHQEFISFFHESSGAPTSGEIEEWAKGKRFGMDDVNDCAYAFAKKYANFLKGGDSKGSLDVFKGADPKLVEIAINIELEHSPDRETAMKIVADHVTECGWIYYMGLPKFEEMIKAAKGKKG